MTKELKTLKNLPTWMPSAHHSEQAGLWALMNSKEIGAMPPEDEGYVSKNELKQLGVSWVKLWKTFLSPRVWNSIRLSASGHPFFSFNADARKPRDEKLIGMISTFIGFFSITEEDITERHAPKKEPKPELYLRSTTETVASGN